MCLSLTGGHNDPVNLKVCDESDEWQKWIFDPMPGVGGPIQSYFDNDLCLDGGTNSSDLTPLLSAMCNGTSPSQSWSQVGDGISGGMFEKLFSIENGCEGVESGVVPVLLQDDLATRYVLCQLEKC